MVRSAVVEDLNGLFELEQQFGAEAFTKKTLRRFLSKGKNRLFVLEDAMGRMVGSAIVLRRKNSTKARLYSFIIHEKHRGAGMGSAYLRLILERLAGKVDTVTLEVSENNEAAIRMYEACGFELDGRVEGYYRDGSAALKMHRSFQNNG